MNKRYFFCVIVAALFLAACGKTSFRKTAGGLPYRIVSGNDTTRIVKGGYVKFYITQKINDSVFYTNFGKMPAYSPVGEERPYELSEIWKHLHKGDSVLVKASMDTFIKRDPNNPDFLSGKYKKGDRITFILKVLDYFATDSLYQKDYDKCFVDFAPQRKQEELEYQAKMMAEIRKMREKEDEDFEKSGTMKEGISQIESYLSSKKINAQKAGKATFVEIKKEGAGELPRDGQYLTVKYQGRVMRNDSLFDAGTFPFQLGGGQVIRGWDEGMTAFRKGSSGTLYIPGFRAYGKNPPQGTGFLPDEALIFDVELLNITDTMPSRQSIAPPPSKN